MTQEVDDLEKENKANEFLESYLESENPGQDESAQQIIQITFDQQIPVIHYNNLSISEIIGALEMVKQLFLEKYINVPIYKNNLVSMAESIK